jgi:sigma-54 dependent transcriptional regulator, acetoin dehydrogenase operon transcriptional activator AcoR
MNQAKQGGESAPAAVEQAREVMLDLGTVPVGLLPTVIEMSWERCLSYGLDHNQRSEFDVLERSLLADQIEKNRHLLIHAQPVMDVLFEQIVDTQNVLLLSNDTGYILHSCGDPEFLTRAEKVALAPGAEWSEASRGTNAIGTALAIGAPVVVHGDQHFLLANHFLTCSASPIIDPFGRLIGILDLSGDQSSFSRHAMALVRMSAQMIENRMFTSTFNNVLILRFHARPEFVGTLCEGMAAFDEDGLLLSANRNACFQLGKSLDQMRGSSFASLFGQPISRLFDHLLARPQDPIILTLNNGIRVQGQADFRPLHLRQHFRHVTQSEPAAPAPCQTTKPATGLASYCGSTAAKAPCPLERLRTGDPKMNTVVEKVKKVIGRDIPILILGETGTGKELLANAIHCASPRAAKPFVVVNCAAIPEGLIESELFGYEEGAFTGARRKGNIGRIVQANGGTLFLDEIGDMPGLLQGRLLRVLQERVVVPLGSIKSYPVDIAVICATHQQIRELVSAGRFREDLYFRINGLTVRLPPLRMRTDFDALVGVLLQELGGAHSPTLDPEVRDLFRRHPWPGNLRQLSYLLRTALVMAEGKPTILREHLPDDFIEDIAQGLSSIDLPETAAAPKATSAAVLPAPTFAPPPEETAEPSTGRRRLQDIALQAIRDAIARSGGNVSAAARELGVSRSTLYRKLQE